MALLKPRNIKRWLHPRAVIYIIGLVEPRALVRKGERGETEILPDDTPEAVKDAETRALDTLRHCAEAWGLAKVKRSGKAGSGTAYTEESVLNYIAAREAAAGSPVPPRE
jgi:hypothetical protein